MSDDDLKIILDKRHNTTVKKQMLSKGLPKAVWTYQPFRLKDKVSSFTSQVEGLRDKRIEKSKQIESIVKLSKEPFLGNYVTCISGMPHDIHAKLLAAYIMMKATQIQMNTDEKREPKLAKFLKDKGYPVWHNLYGGFDNPLLKNTGSMSKPSMIIIANVTLDSTAPKIEKLRDILEAYSSIPRIVVVAGTDPLTLFHSRLYSNLNFCCHIGSSLTKKSHIL